MRPHGRQGAGAHPGGGAEADRCPPCGGRDGRAHRAPRAHRRRGRRHRHLGYRRERQAVHHRRAHFGGLLQDAQGLRPGAVARARLRRVRGHGVVRDRHSRSGFCTQVCGGDPEKIPREDAGLQLLAVVQLEAQLGRRDDREIPARARRDGLQVPVHHARRLPLAQLLDVRARARLRARRDERVRRAAAEGVRRRREGLHRGQAPARSRHRVLRRSDPGGHRRQGLDHRPARLDRGRAVLRREEKIEASGRLSTVRALRERRSSLPLEIARTILEGFDRHYRLFREASIEARRLYERAAWPEMQALARERIQMYDRRVEEAVRSVLDRHPDAEVDESLWPAIKLAYIGVLHDHKQPECAETFYNSVACQVLHRRYYHNEFIFWRPAVATEHLEGEAPTYRCFYPLKDGLRTTLRTIALSFGLTNPWENVQRDLRSLVHALRRHFPRPTRARPDLQIQVLASLFFRNKGAYIVGRIINAQREVPFAVPILQNERGELYLDALLLGESRLLVLFSFARAYFFVDMEAPAAYVSFLRWLMPRKPRAEIYLAVGLAKQGKTIFYRDLHYHLKHSTDRFVVAPGIRGLVMLVFTLPSFPYVFKVIRDRSRPPKEDIDRQTVKDRYLMVKLHDRVGRMADTLEYSLVALPLDRFAPELLDELQRECASVIELDGDQLILGHVYIERRMRPLNLYVEELKRDGDQGRLRQVLHEYGDAIKELAAAGIFPGDMLLKNFGVTRHERVVFYDYDEIQPMGEVQFRRIPPPASYEEELAAEPYWSIGPADVFPEQFERFLVGDPDARALFYEAHQDLLDPEFWTAKQERVRAGLLDDVFPYPPELRFPR